MAVQSVGKNTSYLTISYIGQKMLSFFYFVMIARAIGVEDLGKYTFALSFTTMFAVFVDFGLTAAIIRESAKSKDKAQNCLSTVLMAKAGLAMAVYGAVFLMVNLMGYGEVTRHLVYVSGLVMLMDQMTLTFWGLFRGFQNLKYEAISVLINQLIILVIGSLILYWKLPLLYLMVPFVGGSLFNLVFSALAVKRILKIDYGFAFNKELLRELAILALPFALVAIFSRIYGYMDLVMLSKMVGDKAVGWYSVAMKIPFALQFVPSAVAAAIFPAFSSHFVHNKEQLKLTFDRVMKFLVVMVVPMAMGIGVLAKEIVYIFYGPEYEPSVWSLQILMIGLFFVFLNFPLGALMNGCERQVTNTKLVGMIMILNISLNFWLIPRYGFIGASWVFVICQALLFLLGLIVAHEIIPYQKRSLLWLGLKSVVASLVMAGTIVFLNQRLQLIFLILIGVVVYFGVLYLLRGITRAEIKSFYLTIFGRKPLVNSEIKL